jgi:hypothetical protein
MIFVSLFLIHEPRKIRRVGPLMVAVPSSEVTREVSRREEETGDVQWTTPVVFLEPFSLERLLKRIAGTA